MSNDVIVDYEPGDTLDVGSAAAAILNSAPIDPDGDYMDVPLNLIVPAPGQRGLSQKWVDQQRNIGWVRCLGQGTVLNEVPIDEYPSRSSARLADGTLRPEAVKAIEAAKDQGLESIFEVLIGQHRNQLALECGLTEVTAFVLDNASEHDCAKLFVMDARTARPLRGYDVHGAALVYGEPRAILIQKTLDDFGVRLVPGSPKPNQLSCIRALEKLAGDPQKPDETELLWGMEVLRVTFPDYQWPDALVQGLTMKMALREWDKVAPAVVGALANKRWKGSVKEATQSVQQLRKVVTAPNPQAAGTMWEIMLDAAAVPLKASIPKTTKKVLKPQAGKKATTKRAPRRATVDA